MKKIQEFKLFDSKFILQKSIGIMICLGIFVLYMKYDKSQEGFAVPTNAKDTFELNLFSTTNKEFANDISLSTLTSILMNDLSGIDPTKIGQNTTKLFYDEISGNTDYQSDNIDVAPTAFTETSIHDDIEYFNKVTSLLVAHQDINIKPT